jgi:hypothetical protein
MKRPLDLGEAAEIALGELPPPPIAETGRHRLGCT